MKKYLKNLVIIYHLYLQYIAIYLLAIVNKVKRIKLLSLLKSQQKQIPNMIRPGLDELNLRKKQEIWIMLLNRIKQHKVLIHHLIYKEKSQNYKNK